MPHKIFVRLVSLFLVSLLPVLVRAADVDVGGLTGVLGVAPTGAAIYSIPLTLPPGVAGATPKLSLEYNSQAGLGIAGMGWSLGGQSGISRCPQTKAVDGANRPVSLDTNDRFCLDGQRLILISGSYGGNNATYRTRINNFARITSYTHPLDSTLIYFKVETKDGKTLEYGSSLDAVLRPNAIGKESSPLFWALSRAYDKYQKGQLITYGYIKDEANGQNLLSTVKYAFDTLDANPKVEVDINYDSIPSIEINTYFTGNSNKQNRLLNNISVLSIVSGTTMTEVERFTPQYRYTTLEGLPELTSFKACSIKNGNQTCLKPINFLLPDLVDASSLKPFQMTMAQTPSSTSGWNASYVWPGDYNGDGFTDLLSWDSNNQVMKIWYKNADGTLSLATAYNQSDAGANWDATHAWAGDYNGDGRTELLSYYQGKFTFFGTDANGNFYKATQQNIPTSGWDADHIWVGDFNGDGRTDLLSWAPSVNALKVWYSTGSSTMLLVTAYNQSDAGANWDAAHAWTGDYNGDGKTEVLSYYQGQFTFWGANPDGSFYRQNQTGVVTSGWDADYIWPGDYNGDGLTDLLSYSPSDAVMDIWYSHGNGSLTMKTVYNSSDVTGGWSAAYTWAGDYNADGKMDLLSYWSGQFTLWTPQANGMLKRLTQTGIPTSGWDAAYAWPGDYNGDGLPDLISYSGGIFTKWLGSMSNTKRLKGVDTYTGISYIDYAPLTDTAGVYLPMRQGGYPIVDIVAPIYVVKSLRVPSPVVGSQNQTDYKYAGLSFDVNQGAKGFLAMASIDQLTKKRVDTSYANSFPYTGMVLNQSVAYCSAAACLSAPATPFFSSSTSLGVNLLTLMQNSVDVQTLDGATTVVLDGVSQKQKVHFPYVKSTVTNSYEPPAVN